jgi:hypothetical protein
MMIRSSWKTFRECETYVVARDESAARGEAGPLDADVRGQVLYGAGLYDLLLSLLPPSGTKVVGIMGISGGDLASGVRKLARVYREGGVKAPFAAVALLHFDVILASHMAYFGEDPPMEVAEFLLASVEADHPRGGIFGTMRGRLLRMQGRLGESVARFDALCGRVGWAEMDHMAWYEAAWALLLDQKFDLAARLWDTLRRESKWSKAFYAYMTALSLWAADPLDPGVRACFDSVRGFVRKKSFGGNVPPIEEYAMRRAKDFLDDGNLHFPIDEIVLFWNSFGHQRQHLSRRLARIDRWLATDTAAGLARQKSGRDQLAIALLLRGSMLAAMRTADVPDARMCNSGVQERICILMLNP